jgi:hypothetical protein
MRVKLLVASLILLSGLVAFGIGVLGGWLLGRCVREALRSAPAVEEKSPEEADPTHGLPLEITIDNVPEVPKEIQGPRPPIEKAAGGGGSGKDGASRKPSAGRGDTTTGRAKRADPRAI